MQAVDDDGESVRLTFGSLPAGVTAATPAAATVTIVDDDDTVVNLGSGIVVSLEHVPDGTVAIDGTTIVDGSAFAEGYQAWYRVRMRSDDPERLKRGADVWVAFEWSWDAPVYHTRHLMGIPSREDRELVIGRTQGPGGDDGDYWETYAPITDNDVGGRDGTLTVRITRCLDSDCTIGTPDELTIVITDDDGGRALQPPSRPDRPILLCPAPDSGVTRAQGIDVRWHNSGSGLHPKNSPESVSRSDKSPLANRASQIMCRLAVA